MVVAACVATMEAWSAADARSVYCRANGHQSSLARAVSDLERNTRSALLSPTKAVPPQNGATFAPAAAKPPGTPTGEQIRSPG